MSICYTLPDFPIKYDIVHSSNEKEDIHICTVAAGLFSDRTSYRIMQKNLENFKVVTGYDC